MTQTSLRTVKIEPCAKRVRAYLAGKLVMDSLRPFLGWEWPYFPTYYLPAADFLADLIPAGPTARSPDLGDGVIYHVRAETACAESAAMIYPDSPVTGLRDLVRLEWKAMSEWFEEDEPLYKPEDRRAGQLLQREGGHLPGRRASGPPGGLCLSRYRGRCGGV